MIPRPRWCRVCRRMVCWERVKGVRQCQTCGHPVYGLRRPKALRTRKPLGWKRAAAKANGAIDEDTWTDIIQFYFGLCAHCEHNEATQQDHVVPLARGGEHVPANVVPSCEPCNMAKGTQTWEPRRRHPFMQPVGKEQSA